jgi:DNA-binding winged helix-turn-helix (wHTH) protein
MIPAYGQVMIPAAMRCSFGEFVVDTDQRRVFARRGEVHLARKAFDLLSVLLENRPKALSKGELLSRMWPHTAVTEGNLATLIADLRKALGDDAQHPRCIRTVYAYGYAFAADVTEDRGEESRAAPSQWVLTSDEHEIALHEGVNTLGRSGPATVTISAPSISKRHARVSIAGEQVVLEDLQSKNGTWVGRNPVSGPTVVSDGDEIRLGALVLILRRSSRVSTTEPLNEKPITS